MSVAPAGGAWKSGLFDCFSDCGTCIYGFFCTPCLYGQTTAEVQGKMYNLYFLTNDSSTPDYC